MPDASFLVYAWLVPAVVGYTQAIKNQFPSISGLSPFIAVLVAIGMYYAAIDLPPALFGLIFLTGTAMGVYTVVKTSTTP